MAAVAAIAAVALAVAGCSGPTGASQGSATITLWNSGSMDPTYTWMKEAAKKYEAAHKGVSIQFVEKPSDNYFAGLKTSFLSNNGPDIAMIYPGTYMTSITKDLADLTKLIPAAQLDAIPGTKYYSGGAKDSKAVYGIAPTDQFYAMWYNKSLFAKAGISSPPKTFAEMRDACSKLSAIGVTAYASGSPSFVYPGVGATQDWTYLASALSVPEWEKLLDGDLAYNDPALVDQVKQWAALGKAGCSTTEMTTQDGEAVFNAGKVGMFMSYSGTYAGVHDALGDDVGVMVPPWSATPQKTLAEYPGTGFAVSKRSPNKQAAADFLAYTVSTEGQQLVAQDGGLPILPSVHPEGEPLKELQTMASSGDYTLYPFLDNYMPSEVVAQINTTLPQAYVGSMSPKAALDAFQQAYESIPKGERGGGFGLGS